MVISHNLNDVFEVADRIAVLRLGRMVAQDRLSAFDRQSVVDYMTTGTSSRDVRGAARQPAGGSDHDRERGPGRVGQRVPDGGRGRRRAAPDLTAAAVERRRRRSSPRRWASTCAAWLPRVRGGDAGVLPVVVALVAVAVVFTDRQPQPRLPVGRQPGQPASTRAPCSSCWPWPRASSCCSARSTSRSATSAAIGGIVAAQLVQPDPNWPWWAAIIAALLVCAVIGGIQGMIITRLGLPSFIVTLAGYLLWFGVMLIILGSAGGVGITSTVIAEPAGASTASSTPTSTRWSRWIGLAVVVVLLGGTSCGSVTPGAAAAAWSRRRWA